MSRSYAETALIRQASEERISNRWKKHLSMTQSLQQLKRDIILIPLEEELDEVLPANKAKKELILFVMPFLELHKSKVWKNGISIWFPFVSSGRHAILQEGIRERVILTKLAESGPFYFW